MNRKVYILVFFLFGIHPLFGQQKNDSVPQLAVRQPRLVIKWAPLSLIDPHSTIQLGAEYLLGGPWGIQQEIGYGKNFEVMAPEEYRNREIWRSRTEIRKYVDDAFKPEGTGAYFALEVLYKRINYNKNGRIGRDCADGGCEYAIITDYTLLKDVVALHVKFGGQFVIAKRLVIDVYMGPGLRNITVKAPGYPSNPDIFRNEEMSFIKSNVTMPGNHTLISMAGGFKLGYMIYQQ